jgi:signal transduction histidine kinase
MMQVDSSPSSALVLCPQEDEGRFVAGLLRRANIVAVVCRTVAEFERAIGDHASFAVLAEEALFHADMHRIQTLLGAQPRGSDFPFIVLTRTSGGREESPQASALLEALGNAVFVERPIPPTTFISVAMSVLRARMRQYQTRSRICELCELNHSLETKVLTRTAELEEANRLMREQMEKRQRAEELLRQSQKMEVMGQLTGGIAHDFNNLLTAVISNLELLSKRVRDRSLRRLVENALQGAERGTALSHRLLAFARRQELDVRPREMVRLLKGMADLISRAAGSTIRLKFDLPMALPPVLVDANQFELAILNLVVNGRDAMPGGGELTIAADVLETIGEGGPGSGAHVRIIVRDTGVGMDAKTLARAQEPFFSTKPLGQGTGLGLAIVHSLALQLNGRLQISSEVGRGTTVEIILPIAASSLPVPAEPIVAPPRPGTAPVSVLLVDDDALILDSTAFLLEDMGHRVIRAESGERALSALDTEASIDAIVADYSMPGMTGIQLAEIVRARRPHLPILITSGYAEFPAGEEGRFPRLDKPYQQHQLASALAALLGSRSGGHDGDGA